MYNDLTRPTNCFSCEFRNRKDLLSATKILWRDFFRYLKPGEPRIDLAIWEIGDRITVRQASTLVDESNRKFKRPQPLYTQVKDYDLELREIKKQKTLSPQEMKQSIEELDEALWEKVTKAIIQGFEYKTNAKRYQEYNPDGKAFTVVATRKDAGLQESEFTPLWSNESAPSMASIRRKIKAARGRPLPKTERKPSVQELHMQKINQKRKEEETAAREYWAREKEKAEGRKPAIRKQVIKQIETAMIALKKSKSRKKKPTEKVGYPFLLKEGNQSERRCLPQVTLDQLVEIQANHLWSSFNEYDNRVHEYSTLLLEPALKQAKVKRLATLWGKLNRPQKVFFTFQQFTGEVDNGGVWQFLFNDPELALAALEMLTELKLTRLKNDFKKILEEVVGKGNTLVKLRKRFEDKKLTSAKRWAAFAEGYGEFETTVQIEKYFYTEGFKKLHYKSMSDYIESTFPFMAYVPETTASR